MVHGEKTFLEKKRCSGVDRKEEGGERNRRLWVREVFFFRYDPSSEALLTGSF